MFVVVVAVPGRWRRPGTVRLLPFAARIAAVGKAVPVPLGCVLDPQPKARGMSEVILHHYPFSPFSEKVRCLLAFKQLPWRAVEQPVVAPKPALTPLTGGYRRIPVMQLGADIYCDTALIVRVLERRAPAPSALPAAQAGAIALLEDWADHRLFMQVVPPVVAHLADELPPAFFTDREAMAPSFTRAALLAAAPHALAQARVSLDRLEAQLRHADFVLGNQFTVADAACFHCVWFLQHGGATFDLVRERKALHAWFERIAGFGSGKVTPLGAEEALAIAKAARPVDVAGGCSADSGLHAGQRIAIVPDDYGREETVGAVVRANDEEVVVLREDAEVGEVAVHYPRAGYVFRPA